MTTYSQIYQFQEPAQVFFPSTTFTHGQYEHQRSKTPTSLVNHTGLSPRPLSTPSRSRHPSQQPEPLPEQIPEHMVWNDAYGSSSDSPNSISTPDNETFEVDMLDPEMRNFYSDSNGNMITTQVSHDSIPAMNNDMHLTPQGTFTDQAVQEALNASLASYPLQLQTQFQVQRQPQQAAMPASTYDHFYGQNYTNQPTRQDPWTGEAPLRNSNVLPHSGMAMFDPISDPTSTFPSLGVDDWMNNNGNYVISPTGPPANATFFHGTQPNIPRNTQPQFYNNMHNQALNTSPVDLIPTLPSPSPDSQNFINYNQQHSFFKEHYNANLQTNPVPSVTSSMGKQIHFQYQGPSSPQASAPSPSSSDGIFSSYNSDSGMMLDRFPNEHFDAKLPSPQSPMQSEYSSTVAGPDGAFNASPEPEHSRQATGKGSGRPGGRALGTHLDPNVAKAAHDMRKIVACWHCVLQRDKCGPGDVCDRCVKRSQRPNADCGLGCSRIKLIELSQSFLPTLVTQMHEDAHLTHFVSQHIHQWGNTEISLYITCGARMPRMQVKVYEFLPKGTELLYQIQYKTNPATRARYQVRKNSPALGMVHINHNEEKKYDKYINDIVDNHIDAFGRLCWMEDDNDFQQKLFKLLTRVKPKNDNEAKLLHEVFRLIVVTFIMSHTLTIAEDTKLQSLSMMHSFAGADAYTTNFTSPRMTNRQLKYFFSRLHRQILTAVLNTLQQIFKSSKGCDKWLAAFVAVVGMCMAHEDQQKTIHLVMQTRSTTEGFDARDAQARADIACREIDARMGFIGMIFRWKYNRKCNPLREPELDWEKEAGFGDESSVMFVRQVAQLVKENTDFLQLRQNVSISPANQTRYTSRLVSHFLLSFWLPS